MLYFFYKNRKKEKNISIDTKRLLFTDESLNTLKIQQEVTGYKLGLCWFKGT